MRGVLPLSKIQNGGVFCLRKKLLLSLLLFLVFQGKVSSEFHYKDNYNELLKEKIELKKTAVEKSTKKVTYSLVDVIIKEFNIDKKYAEVLVKEIYRTSNLLKKDYDLDVKPYEIASIIAVESGFNRKSYNKYTKATGLMQVTPICIKSVEQQTGIKIRNPFSIRENLFVGSFYYGINKKKYGIEMALVVYNAGYKNSQKRLIASRGNEGSYLRKVKRYFNIFK